MSAYENVVQRIYKLSAEQHKIYLAAAKKELTAGQRKRLAQMCRQHRGKPLLGL